MQPTQPDTVLTTNLTLPNPTQFHYILQLNTAIYKSAQFLDAMSWSVHSMDFDMMDANKKSYPQYHVSYTTAQG